MGEILRIFSYLGFGFGGQSYRKRNGKRKYKVLYEEEGTI